MTITAEPWTAANLVGVPQPLDDTRYEIIDGRLHVSTQPHQHHQRVCTRVAFQLEAWDDAAQIGITSVAPGVLFAGGEAVAPDVAWVRRDHYQDILGEDGKFHAAPDLMVEVLSPGRANEERDREFKLALYSRQGVAEYWLIDWRQRTVQVFRRQGGALHAVATLGESDTLESPLLPGFSCSVARFFIGVPRAW